MHISVVTIGEIYKGITVHPEADRREILEGECQLKGIGFSPPDGLIAATALEYSLTVVTRNVNDFAGFGVTIFNPWDR